MFFREVIKDCEKEYQQESFEKGDSWKTMHIIDLHKKQEEEWNEYLDAQSLGDKYKELIDHILVSLMMAERFRSRIAKAQTSASPTSKEGMELSLNPIPSQIDNKNNNCSGTKPSSRGI